MPAYTNFIIDRSSLASFNVAFVKIFTAVKLVLLNMSLFVSHECTQIFSWYKVLGSLLGTNDFLASIFLKDLNVIDAMMMKTRVTAQSGDGTPPPTTSRVIQMVHREAQMMTLLSPRDLPLQMVIYIIILLFLFYILYSQVNTMAPTIVHPS